MKKLRIAFCCIFLFGLVSPCMAARWPGEIWLKYATPEEAGFSSEKLRRAEQFAANIGSAAVMVVYRGAVVVEWGNVIRRLPCKSVRKSYLSALYGIHVENGNIDLNKTMAELGIDDEPPLTDAEKQAKIIHLLKARSGVYHTAAYEGPAMTYNRPERGTHAPDTFFFYKNWDFNTLLTIFEELSGTRIFEEFKKQFADPLQMQDFRVMDGYYHLERDLSIHSAYPFRMSARDMARFGLVFCRNGRWKDKQIVSEKWVKESKTAYSTVSRYGYGYMWWPVVKGPLVKYGIFSALGSGGQSIDVLGELDMVFVNRSDCFATMVDVQWGERLKLLQMIIDAQISEPKPNPKLVASSQRPKRTGIIKLDRQRLEKYAGHYQFEMVFAQRMFIEEAALAKARATQIKKAGNMLRFYNPMMGQFNLPAVSETSFIIEDMEAPLSFELDEKGNPVRIIAEFMPGKKSFGHRVVP